MSLGVDRVCVVIGRTRHRMVERELQEAARRGARFIELRLDFLARATDFNRLLQHKSCPLIATVRRSSDGGRWNRSEEERHMLLRQAIAGGGFDWVDLETDVAEAIPRFGSVKRIVSYHNMQETPQNLEEIYAKMCKQDADVVKLAVNAESPKDNLRILNLFKNAPKPTVAHCMGEIGFPSRLLALKFGAPFIYAAFNRERNVAPGLPSFADLKDVYHVERINADTEVFGVVGDPVGHSLSPFLHNKTYHELGVNALYLPFRFSRGEFDASIKAFDSLPVRGYSVTIPHKEAAAAICKDCDDTVRFTRAANTLLRTSSGFRAMNTDYDAVQWSLAAHLKESDHTQPFLKGKSVMILGAGGVARAIAHAVRKAGAGQIVIASRTFDRAARLAIEVDAKPIDWKVRHNGDPAIVINGTPIGMHPNTDDSPLHKSFLKPGLIVFETVYTPENTLLVKEARDCGCGVITGSDMFVRQAALQMKHFVNRDVPLDDLRDLLREAISPLTYSGGDD